MARRRTTRPARESTSPAAHVFQASDATLLDLLDRLLVKGVMLNGDLVLGVAGVDLIYLRLSTLLCAADWLLEGRDIYSSTTGGSQRQVGRIPADQGRAWQKLPGNVAKIAAKNIPTPFRGARAGRRSRRRR